MFRNETDVYTRFYGSALALALGFCAPALTASAQECSVAKTNDSCTFTIDRRAPVAPPTIQMYPGTTLRVQVRDPYYFERYSLDYTSGQVAIAPDPFANAINGLLTPLQKAAEFYLFKMPGEKTGPTCTADSFTDKIPVIQEDIVRFDRFYTGCLNDFGLRARALYRRLEPLVYPDNHSEKSVTLAGNEQSHKDLKAIAADIEPLFEMENQMSAVIAATAKKFDSTSDLTTEQSTILGRWVNLAGSADSVAKDLYGFATRIDELPSLPERPCTSPQDPQHGRKQNRDASKTPDAEVCVELFPLVDPPVASSQLVTRQVTYAIDALNLIQNSQEAVDASKRKTIASVTVLYGDSRWEGSTGILVSTLAVRSFPVIPVFTNGAITDKLVGETILHPGIVPFVAANYRLTQDLNWTRWRSAIYWTLAVGVNPNTVSADFATGPSISWRGLMVSALWHVGHDVRATQGMYKGQSLGAGFSGSVSTENYWRLDRFAIGVSLRVPAITGR